MKNSKSITSNLLILGCTGLLFVGACSNTNPVVNTENPATSSAEIPADSVAPVTKSNHEHGASKGGQVVETGTYHLEFLADKEAGGSHLDLYLLTGDTHETVPNANVTAQIQTPDGTEKTLPFTYDAEGKHYMAMLNEAASGQYQVRITADVKGETVNGRFSFNR
ncbi:hypothetical protein [Nodularia spumigena]|jgi:hypothetical protein|uniref:YtkA-like domain-containing protein n=1 Tax=Nodularia spumigena UHCC 0060 TaxID=3110300 RepID=A0ABU5ULN0_NODSP|nr:hypothetical protein [Nodularia spumigena]MEA5525260.1 hypothetical protein [Nodularia spumigena UHCC 0143]MEA5557013.1 hypothetical protein [Nodularia spumigena CH309]MEA5607012.1 hypothetical protein [Nodularia spumigena UHCC 0060]MEA5614736.1 hypothetical protein [Nodularia spumigena UHCC 0040]